MKTKQTNNNNNNNNNSNNNNDDDDDDDHNNNNNNNWTLLRAPISAISHFVTSGFNLEKGEKCRKFQLGI